MSPRAHFQGYAKMPVRTPLGRTLLFQVGAACAAAAVSLAAAGAQKDTKEAKDAKDAKDSKKATMVIKVAPRHRLLTRARRDHGGAAWWRTRRR